MHVCVADCLHNQRPRTKVPYPSAPESFLLQHIQRELRERDIQRMLTSFPAVKLQTVKNSLKLL